MNQLNDEHIHKNKQPKFEQIDNAKKKTSHMYNDISATFKNAEWI